MEKIPKIVVYTIGGVFNFYTMNIKRINASFAKEAIQDKDFFNFYAISVMVKEKYRSGCVHNYTKNGLAKLLDISTATIERAISFGLKHEYCQIEGTSLIFSKLEGTKMVYIHNIPKTFKEIKYFLKSVIVIDKLRTMKYCWHTNRVKLKKCGVCCRNGRQSSRGVISYNGLSKLLNCSKPSAIKVINFAVKENLIKKYVTKASVGVSDSLQGVFFAYGKILSQPANLYSEILNKRVALTCI